MDTDYDNGNNDNNVQNSDVWILWILHRERNSKAYTFSDKE